MKARYLISLFFIILFIGTIYSLPQNIAVKERDIKCGEIITGNITLHQDLVCGSNGVIIDSNNIIFDCNGYSISAITLNGQFALGNAITLEDKQGVTIRNCKINGYQYGIYLDNSQYNYIYNNILDNNINAYETEDSIGNQWDQNSWATGNGWFDLEDNSSYPNYYAIAGEGNGRDNYPIPTNPNNIVLIPVASQESGDVNYLSQVSLNTETSQAIIRYTLNGSEPNEYSTIYSNPIIINQNTTLKAKAYKRGYFTSQVANYFYTVQIVVAPIASHESGDVNYLSQVSLSSETSQAIIRYTLNGSEPNENSSVYSNPIIVDQNLTLKAKAYKEGYIPSQVSTYNYTVQTVATPTSSQPSGNVDFNSLISLSTITVGAIIRYTLNDTEPNENSSVYSNPIIVDQNLTLKAKAYKGGYIPSGVVTYNYTTVLPSLVIICGDTVDSNVVLTQDINCGQDQWVALNVNANNITIDCNGHTISGSPGIDDWGINIMGRSGITIENCIFTNLNFPIYHEDGSNNIIVNNVFQNTRHGPILRKGSNNLIMDNNIIGTEMDGIGIIGYLNDGIFSSDNNVINNQVINCGSDYASIDLSYAHGTIVRDNNIYATGQYDSSGIMVNAVSSDNLVEHNFIDNGDYGIWITTGSNNNLIKNNRIQNSLYNGLYLDSEIYNNIVTNNDFINNASQAYQEADQTNVWNQNGIGNYWSNHDCIDENAPIGICDNSFNFPGGSDNFPLASPSWNTRPLVITPNPGQTENIKKSIVSKPKPLNSVKESKYKTN